DGDDNARQEMLLRLYHLESTNAVVQSLLQERHLEELLRREAAHEDWDTEAGSPGGHGARGPCHRGPRAAVSQSSAVLPSADQAVRQPPFSGYGMPDDRVSPFG